MPLVFQPGEASQFDWSEDWALLCGEQTKLQVAHVKLSYSRTFTIRAYPLQTHEMLFDAHYHAFRVLGGVPRRGIYDNMRTAVDRVGRGKGCQINARFLAMPSHYLFDAEFCNPAAGWGWPDRGRRPRKPAQRSGREERPGRAPSALAANACQRPLNSPHKWAPKIPHFIVVCPLRSGPP